MNSLRIPSCLTSECLLPDELSQLAIFPDTIHWKHLIVHHNVDPRAENTRREKTLGEILKSITALESKRCHGARQHDRHTQILQFALQHESSLDDGFGSVRDDDPNTFH